MSDDTLRERIDLLLYHMEVDFEVRETFVPEILTAVREALLTPEAVEAGARGIAFVGMEEFYPDQDETWRTADEAQKELFRREIRSGIKAALGAALGSDGHE